MVKELEKRISSICLELFGEDIEAELSRPDEKFGDYSSNAALKLGKKLQNPPAGGPRDIAEQIVGKLRRDDKFAGVSVAGPGFINLTLKDPVLFEASRRAYKLEKSLEGQKVVTEYSDPNPFKVLHAGHLYTSVVGDGISNMFEAAGASVHRVNYGGDVGMHVAKTMWAMLQEIGGEKLEGLEKVDRQKRADWMADCYVAGTKAYEEDKQAEQEIAVLNKKLYQISTEGDKTSLLGQIYWQARQWSYDYFDEFYERIGIKFEKYYPESTVANLGRQKVHEQTPKVYEKSDGAIVYKGEKDGLHTRVFITREDLPTYEAKEVGLIFQKQEDYGFDKSIVITANEQSQYMQVVLASVKKFAPELVEKTVHLTHGMVKLPGAEKMSSRKGNFLKATDILDLAEKSSKEANEASTAEIVLGAVKYSFLKSGLGADIIFDAKESVAIEGNSGPYLQYALVRAKSILQKAQSSKLKAQNLHLEPKERSLARKITIYPEIFDTALNELSPHHICTYLYELAQTFNRFYETNRVIGDKRSSLRLALVRSYVAVLQSGLEILGIETPEKM
jgi:arginyl-tRNA synthetase